MADKKKKNVFVRIFKYLRECFGELKKITWPNVKTTTKNFGIVILVILVVGLFIYGLDRGLYALLGMVGIDDSSSSTTSDDSTLAESTEDEVAADIATPDSATN